MRLAKFVVAGLLISGITLGAVVPASAAVGVSVGSGFGPRPWPRPWYGPRVGFYYGAPLYYRYPYPYAYRYGYAPPPPPAPGYYDAPPARDYGPPPASSEPQQESWYYCQDPQGYYPYVQDCRGEWQAVPSMPPEESGPPQEEQQPQR
jgi:hypothetical protein